MATYYWISAGASTWDTTLKWALTSGGTPQALIPGSPDNAVFDSNGVGNCTAASTVNITNLTMTSGYSGQLDAATYAFNIGGDCTLGGSQVLMGTNTWTINGNFDFQALTAFWAGTATVSLGGTSQYIRTNGGSNYFYNLTITGTYTLDVGNIWWSNNLTINASKTLTTANGTSGSHRDISAKTSSGAQLHLNTGSILTLGSWAKLIWLDPVASGGVATMNSDARIIGGSNATMEVHMTVGGAAGSGSWAINTTHGWEIFLKLYGQHASAEFTFPNQLCKLTSLQYVLQTGGAYNFTIKPGGNSCIVNMSGFMNLVTVTNSTGILKIDNTGASGNRWQVGTDFRQYLNGSTNTQWIQNTETLEFIGTGIQQWDIDFTVGAVKVEGVGNTLNLLQALNCASLDIISGDFDADIYDITVGDVDIAGTGTIDFGNGSTWYISGSFITRYSTGSYVGGNANFEFSGAGKTLWPRQWGQHGGFWFKTGCSYTLSPGNAISGFNGGQELVIDGTVTGSGTLWHYYGAIKLNASGVFTANLVAYLSQNGGGIATWAGTYTPISGFLYLRDWDSTGILTPADYSASNVTVKMYSQAFNTVFKLSAGMYTFHHWAPHAEFTSYTTTINTTNNPSIIVKGNLNCTESLGTLAWVKGSGTITMDSIGDFTIRTYGLELENMVVDKDSSITLASDLNVTSLEISSGDFDAVTYNVTVSSSTLDISTIGTVNCGSGNWTCWGDVVIDGTGTYNIDTADFYLKGTSKGLATASTYWGFENLYVTGSYTCNGVGAADNVYVGGIFDITGTITTGNTDAGGMTLAANTDLRIQTGGVLTGSGATTGEIRWYFPAIGITVFDGTWSNWITQIYYPDTLSSWIPGTYDCRIEWVASPDAATVVNLNAGTYNFTGGLIQFRVGISGVPVDDKDITINLNAATVINTSNDTAFGFRMNESDSTGDIRFNCNNANFNFSGDVFLNDSSAGSQVIYTKGTGTITFEGNVNQTIDMSYSLEDIVVNKSANTVDFSSAITCETYTLTAGGADFNDAATTGAVNITGGAQTMTGTNKTWTCSSFTVDAGVSATVDVNDNNVTVTGTGDLAFNTNCTITMGQRTWTCNGNFFAYTTVSIVRETSTLRLTGTGNFTAIGSASTKYFHNIEIPTGATRTILAGSRMRSYSASLTAAVTIDGTLTIESTGGLHAMYHVDIHLNTGGVVNGAGFIQLYSNQSGHGLITFDGTLSMEIFYLDYPGLDGISLAGVYDCNFYVRSLNATVRNWTPSAGVYTINGDAYFQSTHVSTTLTMFNDTNNPDFVFKGNVSWDATGDVIWRAGIGTITFDGPGDHTIDFNNELIEDVHIEKDSAGKITLNDNFSADSLTITTGKFDANDFGITLTGDFTMANSTEVWAGTGVWNVGGGFSTVAVTTDLFHAETSEVKLTGSGNIVTYCASWVNSFHKLTISGTYTLTAASFACTIYEGSNGWFKIVNGGVLTNEDGLYIRGSNNFIIESGGKLTTNSNAYVWYPTSGYGITNNGIIDGTGSLSLSGYVAGAIASSGNYSVDDLLIQYGSELEMGAGTWTTKNIIIRPDGENLILDMDSNDPTINSNGYVAFNNVTAHQLTINRSGTANDWSIEGNFTTGATGTYIYTKGTANLNFDGSANGTYDCPGFDVESVWIIKSANGLILASNLTCTTLNNANGDFDANDFDVTVANDTDWSTTGTISMGSGTWTLSGSFDYSNFSGTLAEETSLVIMDGTSKTIESSNSSSRTLHDVNIDGTITTAGSGYIWHDGDLNVNGTLTLTGQDWRMRNSALAIWTGGVYINGGGEVTGAGELRMDRASGGGGLLSTVGNLTMATLTVALPEATGVLPAYDYSTVSNVRVHQGSGGAGIFNWQNGAYIFNDLTLKTGDSTNLTINGYTNQPTSITIEGDLALEAASTGDILIYNNHASQALDWIIQGGVTLTEPSSGEVVWTKGTGGIDFTGTANQSVDLDVNGTLEEFTVNKTGGTLTFTGNWISEAFLAVNGELDFNGQTVQTTGDFTINAANGTDATIVSDADAMNATNITVGNDFYVSNITFNATATWYLDVQGASALAFDVGVRYSDADWNSGTTIDATKIGNRDLSVNYNWEFGILANIQSTSFYCFPWTRYTNRFVRGNRRN